MSEIQVRVGQVWQDKDERGDIRQVDVIRVGPPHVNGIVEVTIVGLRRSTVQLDNFVKRFRLIKDVPDA